MLTHRYPQVPTGTRRYPQVPTGTRRYQKAEFSNCFQHTCLCLDSDKQLFTAEKLTGTSFVEE